MILQADARHIPLSDNSVQCCVTSPPYWGLRDYGTATWEGGSIECDHVAGPAVSSMSTLGGGKQPFVSMPFKGDCLKCGARRIDRQLGLERTPEEYVANMVAVFREVKRVLREDGTCWVNMGDSYSSGGNYRGINSEETLSEKQRSNGGARGISQALGHTAEDTGLPPKNLVGIPWRVAFALQADGWTLRSEIIWQKPNPMPESVTDRPTKSHEQIFLFSKARWVGPEQSRFAHISDEDARWLALLFDTEGNIVVKRSEMESGRTSYGLQVAFANTSRELIDIAQRIVGAGSVHERTGTNAPMFYWQLTNIQASELMKRIYRFLIVKQRQARLGIYVQQMFEASRTERLTTPGRLRGRHRSDEYTALLERCWGTMKSLNHFGTPDLSWVPEPVFGHWDSQRYYFDQEAVKEPCNYPEGSWSRSKCYDGDTTGKLKSFYGNGAQWKGGESRNIRSVWTIPTAPYPEAHFATFPTEIPKRCILAGTSARGCCVVCGAPWERVVERTDKPDTSAKGSYFDQGKTGARDGGDRTQAGQRMLKESTGWRPTCTCDAGVKPCVVLDIFSGSGTTIAVAESLGRRGVGLELKPEYIALAKKRCQVTLGLPF